MASASSSSARQLFSDSKSRINQRVQYTVQSLGSLAKNVVKSSKSSEILSQTAKHFAQQEGIIETTDVTLRKMQVLLTHLGYQYESIANNSLTLPDIKDQINSMQN